MNYDEFNEKEKNYISKLLSSDLYKRYKECDEKISNNSEIISLAKKRDEFLELVANNINKKENLIKANNLHKEIINKELTKEYYNLQKKIRDILIKINEKIIREITSD